MTRYSRLTRRQKIFLLVALGFTLGPFLPLIIQSFAFRWQWPDLFPESWWFGARENTLLPIGWDYVLSPHSNIYEAARNTIIVGLGTVMLCLVVALPAAHALARHEFKHKKSIDFFFSLPLIVPETAIGIAILMLFIRLGIAGSYPGVIIAHAIPALPYMLRLLTATYKGLSTDYEEQARLLGANTFQIIYRIRLPLLMPGLTVGALFTFLVSSNIFLLTFLIGQGSIETLPTLLFAKISGGNLDASAAGIALVVTLPGIFILFLIEKLMAGDGLMGKFDG